MAAKQHQIEELMRLAARTRLVGLIGRLIHALQGERGASSLFLASAGARCAATRQELVRDAESAEGGLRAHFEAQPDAAGLGNARFLSVLAWVLLGLDELLNLRRRIGEHRLTAVEAVAAYSRLIAGLVALIFEVADTAIDPRVSGLLVALFNLVQGKELAGQERALGALSFAAGTCDGDHQQRMTHLIDAQERHFQLFGEFAGDSLAQVWHEVQVAPHAARLERLRRLLYSARPGAALDAGLSDAWFECCSERLAAIWSLQRALVDDLQGSCASLVAEARSDLLDSAGLLAGLRDVPPHGAGLTDCFYDPAIPVERALGFAPPADEDGGRGRPLIDLLQAQSRRLAGMEAELAAVRRALDERKLVERAKGMLMARFKLSEDAAYRRMQTASMAQNRRLVEVAEAILAGLS